MQCSAFLSKHGKHPHRCCQNQIAILDKIRATRTWWVDGRPHDVHIMPALCLSPRVCSYFPVRTYTNKHWDYLWVMTRFPLVCLNHTPWYLHHSQVSNYGQWPQLQGVPLVVATTFSTFGHHQPLSCYPTAARTCRPVVLRRLRRWCWRMIWWSGASPWQHPAGRGQSKMACKQVEKLAGKAKWLGL